MKLLTRSIAAVELLLMVPAAVFMTALVVRDLGPRQLEPGLTAEQIVGWYAVRPHVGLWLLLIALPFAALALGCIALWRYWHDAEAPPASARAALAGLRKDPAALLIAATTFAAAVVLAIVGVHVLMN